MKAILKNKLAMTTFATDMLSNFGDTLYYMALMTYILELPDAKLALSALSLVAGLPMLLSFAIGIKADKSQKKLELILATLLVRVALYGILGVFMGFKPALWIVFVAIGFDFISDIAGSFENGLYAPISLRVVPKEDREAFMGFRQSAASLLRIVFQFSGALLIGVMSFQNLAWFNALTFLVSLLVLLVIKPKIEQLLAADPIKTVEQTPEKTNILVEMWESSKLVVTEIKAIPALRQTMIIVPILNALMGVLGTIYVFGVSEDRGLLIGNMAMSQAVIGTTVAAGAILGGLLTTSVAKNWDIVTMVRLSALSPILTFLAFLLHNVYLLLAIMFVTMVIIGAINPKMQALVVNNLPEERLATIVAGIDTYFTAGMLVSQVTVSGLILVFSFNQLSALFLALALGFAAWVFLGNGRADQTAGG